MNPNLKISFKMSEIYNFFISKEKMEELISILVN